uniref:Putative secreted protein n=1 Tax=Ixodes ricinus TaxID=34613 RepID=A0A6B0UBE6_IXORI
MTSRAGLFVLYVVTDVYSRHATNAFPSPNSGSNDASGGSRVKRRRSWRNQCRGRFIDRFLFKNIKAGRGKRKKSRKEKGRGHRFGNNH